MQSKTYKSIAASKTTLDVLELIGNSGVSVTAYEISKTLDINYNTLMNHLATLTECGYIEQTGDGYGLSLKLAIMWAKKKAELESKKRVIEDELKEIGA